MLCLNYYQLVTSKANLFSWTFSSISVAMPMRFIPTFFCCRWTASWFLVFRRINSFRVVGMFAFPPTQTHAISFSLQIKQLSFSHTYSLSLTYYFPWVFCSNCCVSLNISFLAGILFFTLNLFLEVNRKHIFL